jgi:hypothetical protein
MDRSRFLLLIGDQVIRDLVIGDQGGGRMETGGSGDITTSAESSKKTV